MKTLRPLAFGVVASALLAVSPASGFHHHHRPAQANAHPPARAYGPGYYPFGGWQAEAIARATANMQAAPGVTNELAPDAKETATGGPAGGVPGFSGH